MIDFEDWLAGLIAVSLVFLVLASFIILIAVLGFTLSGRI